MHKCTWLPSLCFNEGLASWRLPQTNVSYSLLKIDCDSTKLFWELHLKNLFRIGLISLPAPNVYIAKLLFLIHSPTLTTSKMKSKPWLFHLEHTCFQTGKTLSFSFFLKNTSKRNTHAILRTECKKNWRVCTCVKSIQEQINISIIRIRTVNRGDFSDFLKALFSN